METVPDADKVRHCFVANPSLAFDTSYRIMRPFILLSHRYPLYISRLGMPDYETGIWRFVRMGPSAWKRALDRHRASKFASRGLKSTLAAGSRGAVRVAVNSHFGRYQGSEIKNGALDENHYL